MDERLSDRIENISFSQDQVLHDISVTGARVRIFRKKPPDTLLRVRFTAKTGLSVEVTGRIRRIFEPHKNVVLAGLEFQNLSPAEKETLQAIAELYGKGVALATHVVE